MSLEAFCLRKLDAKQLNVCNEDPCKGLDKALQ